MNEVSEVLALSTEIENGSMSLWKDEKRNAFVNTFDARVRTSQWILTATANHIVALALAKSFISTKHEQKAFKARSAAPREYQDRVSTAHTNYGPSGYTNYQGLDTVGGRSISELSKISEERAQDVLNSLPPLQKVVNILNPEIAQAIIERDAFFEKAKELFEQADELSGALDMADFDQKMSIGDFRKLVVERNKKRTRLLELVEEKSQAGLERSRKIDKFLYAGLPGLSDAVVEVVTEMYEKATGFGAMNRRVAEKVKFGDSEAALQMLSGFEQDEIKISDGIKAKFDAALAKLKLTGGTKAKKQLAKGK